MGLKTAGVGHFTIPTAPAAGTSCTSGAANTFTTTYVQLIASTSAAVFITGIHLEAAAAKAATYIVVQLATGGAGSETVVGQYLVPLSTASTVALGYRQIYPPILVPTTTRIACKTADSVGAAATLVTLECINQSNVVDDGVAVATVTAVTGLTASNLDAAISSRMATYTQPTGFLAATFPTSVASPTNITAGTITTVTNLTNAPTAGDLTATMKTSVTTAATAATPTAAAVTGAVGSVTGAVGSVTGAVGSVTGNVGGNVVGSVASVTAAVTLPSIPANWITAAGITASALNGKGDWLLSSGYTAPDNATIATLATRLTATRAGLLDNLDAAISSRSTYAGGDTAGTTTLLGRVTAIRAGLMDNMDASISSRLATSGYTTPPTAVAIRSEIDANSVGRAAIFARTDVATSSRLATTGYTAPDNAGIAAVKAKTDSLTFTVAGKLDGNITYVNGVAVLGAGTAGSPWGPA